MRKYKVNRDKPKKLPSKEAIEKYKDFPRLRHEYDRYVKRPKKPLYRDKKLFFFLLLIALLAILIAQAVSEEDESEETNDQIEQLDK